MSDSGKYCKYTDIECFDAKIANKVINCPKCEGAKSIVCVKYRQLATDLPSLYKKGDAAVCDECNKDIQSDLLFHCKRESNKHEDGYDLCIHCGLQLYHQQNK